MSTLTTPAYDRADLEAIAGEPVTVNLGCGDDDTGVGVDINYDPDIEADLNEGIPLADDTADVVLANHILEHLENPTLFLTECERVLRPDGELRLEVPNVGWMPVRLWLSQDMHRFWQHKDPERRGHWLARRLGRTDPDRTAHKTLWTKALLAEYLERAGLDYRIRGSHVSKNLAVRATPTVGKPAGRTLHELERSAGDDLAANDYWAQTRARIMTRWIDRLDPESVLDIGCGSGYLTAAIADADPGRLVFGIDNNPESIAVARKRQSAARFDVADAFELPYADGRFDCVIFGDVIEHFEDPEALLCEARRVLAPDGAVIVSVPAFQFLFGPHDEHNGHHERYTAGRLAEVAADVGFDLERHRYTNAVPLPVYFLYQRVLRRPVPDGARGGHNRLVERLKRALIGFEVAVPLPVGITLLGELRPAAQE